MNTRSLSRSLPYWLLIVLSAGTAIGGAWLISDQSRSMTAALLNGTATGVEVYGGQSWIVVGAALVAAGIGGILLSLGLAAARVLVASASPVVVEPIDWNSDDDESDDDEDEAGPVEDAEADAQKGSSGSIAMETNSSDR